jgi:hypothetical protein
MSNTPEYKAWVDMKKRCLNTGSRNYKNYGGRNIAIEPRWIDDFAAFFADIGPRPSPKHSLDRIDNDKGYFPGNVRWALPPIQNNNRSDNRWLTYRGVTLTVAQWSRRTGMPYNTLYGRLAKGWSVKRAIERRRAA